MKALALDMGFAHTGMVIATADPAMTGGFTVERHICLHSGTVKDAIGKVNLANIYKADIIIERAKYLFLEMQRFLDEDKSEIRLLVAEAPSGGGQSAISIQAMGVAMGVMACFLTRLPRARFVNITPLRVKQAVGGALSAGKDQVARNVRATWPHYAWPVKKKDSEHVLDAAAALLACHGTDAYKEVVGDFDVRLQCG